MNQIRKYFVLGAILALGATAAQAELTVKDTVSPEFIHNQGYSSEISRVISVKTKDPMTPIAQKEEKSARKNFRYYLWETLDPAIDRPGNWVNHDIKYHSSIDDL